MHVEHGAAFRPVAHCWCENANELWRKKNNNRERIIISSVGDERCLSYYWRSFLKLHNWLQVGIEACRLSDVNLWIKASSMSTWIVCLVILSATMIYSTKQVHFSLALKHFLHARIENSTEKKKTEQQHENLFTIFFSSTSCCNTISL